MPRKRILKTNRTSIDENSVKQAIIGFFNGTHSERDAARTYGIKRSTLQSRIKKILSKTTKKQYLRKHLANPDDSGNESEIEEESPKYSSKYTNRQVFNMEEEAELEKYIKRCSDINYGLSYVQVQKLAYEYACALPHCKVPQEWHDSKQAKEGWRRGFMERHKTLSLRKPESTSLSRSTPFNKYKVNQFFDNLKKVLDRHRFPAERIYNLDETGVTTVMKSIKVVSTAGKKQVSQAASAERGELVTFTGIINAAGQSIPPVYIFPRLRNIDEFMNGAPISSLGLGNRSGWMTSDLFPTVLKHLVSHAHCSPQNPILLLVDNHESHISLTSVRFCKDNGIILLSFPPHTSHKMQPLDVGVYGPFKHYCSIAFNDWMTSNPGKTITVRNIAELTNRAYLRAFTGTNIISGFKKPGICPFNRLAFSEEDFSSNYVTDKPLPEMPERNEKIENEEVDVSENKENNIVEDIVEIDQDKQDNEGQTTSVVTTVEKREKSLSTPKIRILNITTIKPSSPQSQPSCSEFHSNSNVRLTITPESIRPYPKVSANTNPSTKRKRQPGISKIYTDTPEKQKLEELELEKERKKKCPKRNLFNKKTTIKSKDSQEKKRTIKQKYSDSESSVSDDNLSLNDNSSEDLSDEFEDIQNQQDQDNIFTEGNFVLVRFKVKTKLVHFIGQILKTKTENTTEIKFLRRKGLSNSFYFPPVEDILDVSNEDIVSKLKASSKTGTTRTAACYRFFYNFGNLILN